MLAPSLETSFHEVRVTPLWALSLWCYFYISTPIHLLIGQPLPYWLDAFCGDHGVLVSWVAKAMADP